MGSGDSGLVWLGGLGVRVILPGERTEGRFSVVEHPIRPRTLAAPLHTHSREDEFSYVLEGEIGVLIGDRESVLVRGSFIFKPHGVPHTFWNSRQDPARVLELISPAGFERYFLEAAPLFARGGPPDPAVLGPLLERYGLELDLASLPRLRARLGL